MRKIALKTSLSYKNLFASDAISIRLNEAIKNKDFHHFNKSLPLYDKNFSFSKFVVQFLFSLFDNFKSEFYSSIQGSGKIRFFEIKSENFYRSNENFAKKISSPIKFLFSLFDNRISCWFGSLFRINKRKSLDIRMEILHVKTKFILNFNQLNTESFLLRQNCLFQLLNEENKDEISIFSQNLNKFFRFTSPFIVFWGTNWEPKICSIKFCWK